MSKIEVNSVSNKTEKMTPEERQQLLYQEFLKAKPQYKLKYKKIENIYKTNGIELSEKTIRKDAKVISECIRSDKDYYFLKDAIHLRKITDILVNELQEFTLYQPITFLTPFNIKDDSNPKFQLFSIILELNDSAPIFKLESCKHYLEELFEFWERVRGIKIHPYINSIIIENRTLYLKFHNQEATLKAYQLLNNIMKIITEQREKEKVDEEHEGK